MNEQQRKPIEDDYDAKRKALEDEYEANLQEGG